MKLLITMMLLSGLALTGCSQFKDLFNSAKISSAEKAASEAQKGSIKHLGCETGAPVYADVKKKVESILKVKTKSTEAKSVLGTVCTLAVEPLAKELIDLSTKQLPETWKADGCSLEGFEGDVKKLAKQLCEKI
jgi:hypothetical protein